MDLPAGTAIARKWCIEPLELDQATHLDSLWFYVLLEAEQSAEAGGPGGETLGTVGSTIVCATIAGLLLGDPCSFLNVQPCWTPGADPLLVDGADNVDTPGAWGLPAIIRLSGLPVDADDVTDQTGQSAPTAQCASQSDVEDNRANDGE